MFAKLYRKLTATSPAEFCDTCAQVCTPQCRSQATYEKARSHNLYQYPGIR